MGALFFIALLLPPQMNNSDWGQTVMPISQTSPKGLNGEAVPSPKPHLLNRASANRLSPPVARRQIVTFLPDALWSSRRRKMFSYSFSLHLCLRLLSLCRAQNVQLKALLQKGEQSTSRECPASSTSPKRVACFTPLPHRRRRRKMQLCTRLVGQFPLPRPRWMRLRWNPRTHGTTIWTTTTMTTSKMTMIWPVSPTRWLERTMTINIHHWRQVSFIFLHAASLRGFEDAAKFCNLLREAASELGGRIGTMNWVATWELLHFSQLFRKIEQEEVYFFAVSIELLHGAKSITLSLPWEVSRPRINNWKSS